ncbi:MAG: hydrogenase expression/formation protein HypE [Candidatus Brocadiae bacterium]|nr:hydrogenase expression/formation protein HypE [Candidatus Brocadiia bacterium]
MTETSISCPLPAPPGDLVQMAHGGGGRLMNTLLRTVFLPAFDNPLLAAAHDGAAFPSPARRLAFTTDSYVVRPLFFPGGDIGSLAVHGTVNDLAMCGATPTSLSAGFILEEGLPLETLRRVVRSMAAAAARAGVAIVTGDTKVVERGKGDGVYICTAGIGAIDHELAIRPGSVRAGDAILLSGDLGRHGVAILAARSELAMESEVESDSAPLAEPVRALLASGAEVHCLRDLTRGGLAAAAIEIAEFCRIDARLDEGAIPVSDPVRSACELLGFDPLHLANEGRFAAWVAEKDADRALAALRSCPATAGASRIGTMTRAGHGTVTLRIPMGAERALDMLAGEQLPRIC